MTTHRTEPTGFRKLVAILTIVSMPVEVAGIGVDGYRQAGLAQGSDGRVRLERLSGFDAHRRWEATGPPTPRR